MDNGPLAIFLRYNADMRRLMIKPERLTFKRKKAQLWAENILPPPGQVMVFTGNCVIAGCPKGRDVSRSKLRVPTRGSSDDFLNKINAIEC